MAGQGNRSEVILQEQTCKNKNSAPLAADCCSVSVGRPACILPIVRPAASAMLNVRTSARPPSPLVSIPRRRPAADERPVAAPPGVRGLRCAKSSSTCKARVSA